MVDVVFSGVGGAGWQFFDNNGSILSGGRLYTYLSGTTTPAETYTTSAGNVSNGVYVQLDSAARPPAEIWLLKSQNYKFELRSAVGTVIRTYDGVPGLVGSADFEAFKVALAGPAGAGLTGFSHDETYPAATLGAKGKLTINIQDAPFNAVPGTDCTVAVQAAWAYAASLATTVGGFKSLMPTINLGPGRIIITDPNALAGAFNSSAVWAGVHLVGAGRGQTILEYSSTSAASTNYLANYENCRDVTWEDMTVKSTDQDLRCVLWGPNGASSGGNGSVWTCRSVSFEGPWTEVFTIQGTALGSETTWIDVLGGAGYSGGTFFKILDTNPQSVNHKFIGCTLGGSGTVFHLLAGGDISVYGGYCSLFEGATYLYTDAAGADIGGGNGNILIDGVNFETAAAVTDAIVVDSDSAASILFRACNFFSVNPLGTTPVFQLGTLANQRGGRLLFDRCHYPSKRSVFQNGVSVEYANCIGMLDWQDFMTIQRGSTSQRLAPNVQIRGSYIEGSLPVNPKDCNPYLTWNDYITYPEAAPQFRGVERFHWPARAGNQTGDPGLIVGCGGTYAYFSFKIPLSSILRRIEFNFSGANPDTAANRIFKVENASGTVLMAEETIVVPPTPLITRVADNLEYVAELEADREIRIYGKTVYGTAPATIVDWGWVRVSYD